MTTLPLPSLSSLNGPSSLLHAIRVLNALGVPEANVRLVPRLGHFAFNEVLPCEFRLGDALQISGATLSVRLGINVRDDNRMAWLYPLVAVGLPPPNMPRRDVPQADGTQFRAAQDEPFAEALLAWFMEVLAREPEDDPSTWVNEEPVERLARQLREQFPRLSHRPTSSEDAIYERIRASDFVQDYRQMPDGLVQQRSAADSGPDAPELDPARELGEVFYTRAFLAVACADMLRGLEFDHRLQPPREAGLVRIGLQTTPEDIADWLNTYPHVPREYFGRRRWQRPGYLRASPRRQVVYARDPRVCWSPDDPAVQELYQQVQAAYRARPPARAPSTQDAEAAVAPRSSDITAEEMVAWAEAHVPDFLSSYPRQCAVTGGLSLSGILLGLINKWLDQGQFLGLSRADFEQFEAAEQNLLCLLLLRRRHVLDYAALFDAAVQLLAHPGARVQMRQFVPSASQIGTPMAQLGKSLVLGGAAALHAPEAVVRVPCDRTTDPDADAVQTRLDLLRRVFLPAHVPVRYEWERSWVDVNAPAFPVDPSDLVRNTLGSMAGYVTSDSWSASGEDQTGERHD